MLVAICDDERPFREELRSILFSYKAERRLNIDVYQYPSGEALLASGKDFDMVFLDYQMPGLDGMAVARELRRRSFTCSIIFVTSYTHFVFDAFEVQPYRFLCKPITEGLIEELLTKFIRQQKLLAPLLVLDEYDQIIIHSRDILYLEGSGKCCTVRTKTQTYTSSKTLTQVHALLPQYCFFRTHKSYVVNLYSIQSFNSRGATLTNEEIIRIGRSRAGEFKRVYKQFLKDNFVRI